MTLEKEENTGVSLNPAVELGKRLQENSMALRISRIPKKTKEAFVKLANEEFCGDFGMTLKWLIDDTPNQDTRAIIATLQEHEERLANIELVLNRVLATIPEETGRKMLDGTKRK